MKLFRLELRSFGCALSLALWTLLIGFQWAGHAYASYNSTLEDSLLLELQSPLQVKLNVNYGTNLSKDYPQGSFLFEPYLNWNFLPGYGVELYSALDRPTQPSLTLHSPKNMVTLKHRVDGFEGYTATARLSLSALDVDQWQPDGYQMRSAASLELARALTPSLTASLRAGPFVQFSKYSVLSDGTPLPQFGLSEFLNLTYQRQKVRLQASLLVQQEKANGWKNDYGTEESIAVELHPQMLFGVSYALLSTMADDTTGLFESYQSFPGHISHIALFTDFTF